MFNLLVEMKKKLEIFLVLSMSLFMLVSCNPNKKGEEIIRSYEDQKGVVSFKVPPAMIGMFFNNDDPELKDMFKGLESIKVLMVDMSKVKTNDTQEFASEFEDRLEGSGFSLDFRLDNEGSTVRLFSFEEEEVIKEMMLVVSGSNQFIGLSLSGAIDMDLLTRLAGQMDVNDFSFE